MKGAKQNVIVVVDNAAERQSAVELLGAQKYAVVAFTNATDYLEAEPPSGPTCLVVAAQLPGPDGLELLRRLTELGRCEPIVFTTNDHDVATGIRAMKAGAVDYLLRPFEDGALLAAVVRGLARSEAEQRARDEVHDARARVDALTERQRDVLRLVMAGWLNKQICDKLQAALRTVKRHRAVIMRITGAQSVADLIRLGRRAGLELEPPPAEQSDDREAPDDSSPARRSGTKVQ